MKAIYKRELGSYFQSMTGYLFISVLTAVAGIYFMAYNLNAGYPYFSYALSGTMFILIISIPILTMKSFAEERKSKSDQLLLTSPVTVFDIVLGKYMAMATVFAVPNLIFCMFPLIIKAEGNAYLKVDYLSILVYFLLGCVYIAVGMFVSSLTESQIIAAVGSFGALLILFLWDSLVGFLPSGAFACMIGMIAFASLLVYVVHQMMKNWIVTGILEGVVVIAAFAVYFVKSSLYEGLLEKFFGKLSLYSVFSDIASNHLLDVSGLFVFLSMIVIFIFLTIQSIQKRRWS